MRLKKKSSARNRVKRHVVATRPLRVTLRTVLEHVQAMDARIDKRFDVVDVRIDRVERNLTRQIDGLDKRLDDIEVNIIPALKEAVGAR